MTNIRYACNLVLLISRSELDDMIEKSMWMDEQTKSEGGLNIQPSDNFWIILVLGSANICSLMGDYVKLTVAEDQGSISNLVI